MSNWLLFTNAAGSASGTSDYVKDVFDDVTLEASNNSSLTDSASTNPFGWNFNNTDVPLVRSKTLFIKDLSLMDSAKWLNNKPTYEIIWDEEFPAVKGYISGDIDFKPTLNGNVLQLYSNSTLNLIGVTGIFRRIAFLVQPLDNGSTRNAIYYVDGVAGNTVNYGNPITEIDSINLSSTDGRPGMEVYLPLAHSTSNITKDLHDVQLRQNTGSLRPFGVVVYFDDTSAGVDQRPGVSYVNKNKVSTSAGQTFALSGFTGTSLGGNYLIQKSNSGYTLIATGFSTIAVNGIGLSGTTTVNLDTGYGGSFTTQDIVFAANGTSTYIGKVTNISTDTLTVSPTMTFGLSGIFTRSFQVGATLSINASLMKLSNTIDFTKNTYWNKAATSRSFALDPKGKYGFFTTNCVQSSLMANNGLGGAWFSALGNTGVINIEGFGSAAEMLVNSAGNVYVNLSVMVNGFPAFSVGQTLAQGQKYTLFTNGANQWNSVQIYPGVSNTANAILQNINFYERDINKSISFGVLGSIVANHSYVKRAAEGITMPSLGIARRIYPAQMYLTGGWTSNGVTLLDQPGGVTYTGASTNCVATIEYYGKDFAFLGTNGSSMSMVLDGAAATGASFGLMQTVSTESLHRVVLTHQAGTCVIQGFDYVKTHEDVDWEGKLLVKEELPSLIDNLQNIVRFSTVTSFAAVNTGIFLFDVVEMDLGDSISWTQDANSGLEITIQKSGLYIGTVELAVNTSSNVAIIALSRNVTNAQAIASASGLTAPFILCYAGFQASGVSVDNTVTAASFVAYLNAGDVIRPHGSNGAGVPVSAERCHLSLARIK